MDFSFKRAKRGKVVLWIHPISGEYRVPPDDQVEMPLRYRMQGYERKEFNSYFEHMAWMKSKGLVNHATEDVPDDGDIQRNKWGY